MLLEDYYMNQFTSAVAKIIKDKMYLKESDLVQFVCPIYLKNVTGKVLHIGSSILINIGDSNIIVTAAHVLDEKMNGTLFMVEKRKSIPLNFDFYRTYIEQENTRESDGFDFAFTLLEKSIVSQFETYRFINVEEIDQNFDSTIKRFYTFLGYPGTKNNYYKITKPTAHSLNMPIIENDLYSECHIDPNQYIAIKYDEKNTFNEKNKKYPFPKPYGLSGGGVWGWSVSDEIGLGNPTVTPKLCGIIIEMIPDKKVWIALRITHILEAIRWAYPWLSKFIPITKNFNVCLIDKIS